MIDRQVMIANTISWHIIAVAHGDPDGITTSRYQLRRLGWDVREREARLREPNDVRPIGEPFRSVIGYFLNAVERHGDGDLIGLDLYLEALRVIGWDVRPIEVEGGVNLVGMIFKGMDTVTMEPVTMTVTPWHLADSERCEDR